MPDSLLKQFSIHIEQTICTKMTSVGQLAVYQTMPFGLLLMLNDQLLFSEKDNFFYSEMMSHPALFTHPRPLRVAILGNYINVLQEVMKHTALQEVTCIIESIEIEKAMYENLAHLYQPIQNQKVQHYYANPYHWLADNRSAPFDVIIQAEFITPADNSVENYQLIYNALRENGIFIEASQHSLLSLPTLNTNVNSLFQKMQRAGFSDWQTLLFPQPSNPSGWRTGFMTMKRPSFSRIREKDIFNRHFVTRYYNFDTHKAALVVPEFMRETSS